MKLRARVEGYLDQILVDEGKTVIKGHVLFKINDEEYRAALNKAIAQLKVAKAEAQSAQIELDRVKLLVEKDMVAKTDLDLAKAKLSIAEANIEEAQAEESHAAIRLSNTEIKSPFDGTIYRIPFKIGSLIREGDLLTSISDINSVYILIYQKLNTWNISAPIKMIHSLIRKLSWFWLMAQCIPSKVKLNPWVVNLSKLPEQFRFYNV